VEQELKEKKAQIAVLARLQKWCGIRDRSEREAELKARELMAKLPAFASQELREHAQEAMLSTLREEGFLDDARCAASYARVHHEHKGWGPLKVKAGLLARGVSGRMADEAIGAIHDEHWQEKAEQLLRRRQSELRDHRDRVVRWLIQRGFPQHMVWSALASIESERDGDALES